MYGYEHNWKTLYARSSTSSSRSPSSSLLMRSTSATAKAFEMLLAFLNP